MNVTYTCARCGYTSSDQAQFRRVHPLTIFNECADRERCDQAVLVFSLAAEGAP